METHAIEYLECEVINKYQRKSTNLSKVLSFLSAQTKRRMAMSQQTLSQR